MSWTVQLRQLKIENKKRGDKGLRPLSPPGRSSVKSLDTYSAISNITTYLGFDKSFFVRGANDTEPRNHPVS